MKHGLFMMLNGGSQNLRYIWGMEINFLTMAFFETPCSNLISPNCLVARPQKLGTLSKFKQGSVYQFLVVIYISWCLHESELLAIHKTL